MKPLKNIFDKIITNDNLDLALKHAKSRKNGKVSIEKKLEIEATTANWEVCREYIKLILMHNLYNYFPYKFFKRKERGKVRDIAKLPFFPYRIIDWAIIQVCGDRFEAYIIDQSFAAREGKGTHNALKLTKKYIRSSRAHYCLKIDITKYFEHIIPEKLMQILSRLIGDEKVLKILNNILLGYPKSGIPLGNYISQYFANLYLTPLDHYCKEIMHCHHYIRYMDDIVVFGQNTSWLRRVLKKIRVYLEKYGLDVKGNWQIFSAWGRGVDFVGYRTFQSHCLLRTSTKKRLVHKTRIILKYLKRGNEYTVHQMGCVESYSGILMHCNGKHLYTKTITPIRSVLRYERISSYM